MNLPGKIVIVGGGSAGWMAASFFLQGFGRHGTKIVLIESSNIPTIGVGEGTVPTFRRFLHHLGIPESEFMSACNATYKHGISFPGWTGSREFETYFHPFNSPDYASYDKAFFENCRLRRNGTTTPTDPVDFFFGAEMARQRKAPAGPPPCDPNRVGYAYHFDAGLLAEFLKRRSIERGIQHIVDDVSDVVVGENGDIEYLQTAGSGRLEADFYVDCTGFARRLIGRLGDAEPLSYKPRLFNDSAVVLRTPSPQDKDIPPYTSSRALECGWSWRIPLVTRIGWGYVYSSDYTSAEEAEKELRARVGPDSEGVPARQLRMQVGRVEEHWKNNCVAIGLSQGFIEPLEATALGLTQYSINMFAMHYHKGGFSPQFRDEYNGLVNKAFDTTVDYIQMHYKLNTRTDTQYWIDCRNNDNISDTMRHVIQGWDDSSSDFDAVLAQHVRSSYAPYSWYCILSGMGRFPDSAPGPPPARPENPYRASVSQYFGHRQYLSSLSPA